MKTIHIAHTVTKTVKSKEFPSSSYDHNVSVLYLKPFLGILVKFFNSANKPFLRQKNYDKLYIICMISYDMKIE